MFSKYTKKGGAGDGAPELKSIPGGQAENPVSRTVSQPAPKAENKRRNLSRVPAQAAPVDKERKRKERLGEIKLELHKRLLDNLNLGALDTATESDLRSEIVAISGEALDEMGVVLNREERQTLNQDLYDEVTGLGPLEPLLKDDTINDILVNGPQQVFVERSGRLELTGTTFKDEKHLLRIIDRETRQTFLHACRLLRNDGVPTLERFIGPKVLDRPSQSSFQWRVVRTDVTAPGPIAFFQSAALDGTVSCVDQAQWFACRHQGLIHCDRKLCRYMQFPP